MAVWNLCKVLVGVRVAICPLKYKQNQQDKEKRIEAQNIDSKVQALGKEFGSAVPIGPL